MKMKKLNSKKKLNYKNFKKITNKKKYTKRWLLKRYIFTLYKR